MFPGPVGWLDDIVHKVYELCCTDAEDFCKIYILLALNEFHFPNTSCIVSSGLFKLGDDPGMVDKYNSGVAVYDNLVESLPNV